MKAKHIKFIVILFSLCIVFLYLEYKSGYGLTERQAISYTFPEKDIEVVYEEDFNDRKIAIFKIGDELYSKMIQRKWGIIYKSLQSSRLTLRYENDLVRRAWSANLNSNEKFDTFFAVQARDPAIKKVIITNDDLDQDTETNIEQIRKDSSLYIELNIRDGFASKYLEMDNKDVGSFVFRGLDANGNVVVYSPQ